MGGKPMSWVGKTPTPDEMRSILESHARWWRGENGGTRADLKGADLTGADLTGADLTAADLRGADLTRADLTGADLTDADLTGADLRGADLAGAGLRGADLTRADLTGADLTDADLRGAVLTGAKDAGLAIARTRILPAGDLIGWKKCSGGEIVRLRIPADAKRSHAFGRKCRAEHADVLEVIGADVATTQQHGPKTEYRAGQRVTPDSWDDDWTQECSHGIHFYITREEAEAHS